LFNIKLATTSSIIFHSSEKTKLLRFIAKKGEGAILRKAVLAKQCEPEQIDSLLSNLLQIELLESTMEGYRFQIELIRRWFVLSDY
jgi:hypothetical protein